MFDYDGMRAVVATGLRNYLNCPVIRSNQNEMPSEYPFISYTITTLVGENNGTYGEYDDGIDRKPITQTWSVSALADNNAESVQLAIKAREWLDHVGTTYLSDNNVIVQSVGNVTNRDNVLSVEYEYKNGFDIVFWLLDEVEYPKNELIEKVDLGVTEIEAEPTAEELNESLEKRLTGR